ncbi:MAG: apolipoprotein N-acyltransferase [Alphaproteobacteria bacterium]|nr:apolipoprotein N-acyltransferase [Alphaproteobacteria bacterium]
MKAAIQHRLATMQKRHRLIASFILGVFSAFGFAPYSWLIFIGIGLTGLYALVSHTSSHRINFWIGYLHGLGMFGVSLYWINNAMFVDLSRFWWLIPIGVLTIPAILSFYVGASTYLFSKLKPFINMHFWPLLFSLLWCVFEWLRGHMFTGFPWNLLGYTLSEHLPMIQIASIFGVYGLSLILCFALVTISHSFNFYTGRGLSSLLIPTLLLSMLYGFGFWRLQEHKTTYHETNIRLVQPNISQKRRWDFSQNNAIFIEQLDLAYKTPSDKPIHLIILPEAAFSSIPLFFEHDPLRRQQVGKGLMPGALMIVGASRFVIHETGEDIYNSIIVIDHKGDIVSTYDKSHLVPFGEYIPLRKPLEAIFPTTTIRKITAGDRDFSFGTGIQSLNLNHYPAASPLVCYEVIFPGKVTPKNSHRSQWLLNLTNDAWYGNSAGPYQHVQIAQMRAVEEGMPMVRVAFTGISAIFDAVGRPIKMLPLETKGVIDSPLPKPLDESTPYSQRKDVTLFGLALFLLALSLLSKWWIQQLCHRELK